MKWDFIQKGLEESVDLGKEYERLVKKDELLEMVNAKIWPKYKHILSAQYFLIENAQRISIEEPWRNITPCHVSNNFRAIILMIMRDIYNQGLHSDR